MATLRFAPLFVLALLAAVPTPSHAGGTRSYAAQEFDDLDQGETEGAAIESSGRVTVGFVPQRAEIGAMTAFTCLGNGKHALIATADKAAVLTVAPDRGKSYSPPKDKAKSSSLKVATLAELDGVLVSALATLPGGDVLAATLPGGNLHRIDGRGRVQPFAQLGVDQIWALRVHDGRVYAATGPRGELWSLSLSGKDAKIVLDTEEKDVLSLAVVGNELLAGTAPTANLYQVSDAPEGILLHEFAGDEVRAIALTPRGLVVAVNDFSERKLSGLDALTKTLNRTSLIGQPPAGSQEASESPPSADAALYHVDLGAKRDLARATEAPWEKWLSRDKQYFTALLVDDGAVLIASSAGGKVYRVRGPRSYATVADLEERQATGLCRVGDDGPIFATSAHGAAVYQLRAIPATQARYRSEVIDAGQPSRYGAVVVRGRGDLRLRVRTGPTQEPDDRWSDWQEIALRPSVDGHRGDLGQLPRRRNAQLELTLGDARSEVRGFELFYAPENLPPLLRSVDISHPEFDRDDDKESSPTVTIKWKAEPRDEDDLVYEVRIRPEGGDEKQWLPLHRNELVTNEEFKLDLDTVPDGIYEVAVRASDEPSNGSASALHDELVSAPFIVDRQRPVITGTKVEGRRIRAAVSDVGGYVHDVAYAIDGGPFRAASVEDGLLDTGSETMLVELPKDLEAGRHRVVLRARDSFGNIGTVALFVTAP